MMIKVEIATYKQSGKLNQRYTTEIETNKGYIDSDDVIHSIESIFYMLKNQNYTYKATAGHILRPEELLDERLVINKP